MILPPPRKVLGRILVVDDEEDACNMTAEFLSAGGYEVETARSGFEALDKLAARPFDLVLLDILMEGMDGFETLKRIRALPDTPYIPVIVLTALDSSHRDFGIERGADDYISKPYRMDDLLARVKVGLRLKRLHDQLYAEKEKVSALYRIAKALNSMDDLEQLAAVLAREVKAAFDAHHADFLVLSGGVVRPLLREGLSEPVGDSPLSALRSLSSAVAEAAGADDVLFEPVSGRNGPLGALVLLRSGDPFTPEQREALGELSALFGAVMERCLLRRSLEEDERRLRHVVENACDAFFLIRPDGRITPLNTRCADLFSVPPERLESASAADLLGAPAAEALDALMALSSAGSPAKGEVPLERSGKVLQVSMVRVEREAGDPFFECLARDVTDERLKISELDRERRFLEQKVDILAGELAKSHEFAGIVSRSPLMFDLFARIRRIAATDATVLITGETGTGKELVARAVHYNSRVKDGPFVKVDCGALPRNLLESELFGHVKGAFTGAVRDRTGRFELARGGSIFLDEMGNLPLDVQAKLLRVLQDGLFEPVGSTRTVRTDARIIAATNADLPAEVRAGRFRSDLYFRLNVAVLEVPPLRDRPEDVPLLAHHFLNEFNLRHGRELRGFSPDALSLLESWNWPGNVRELRNVVEEAVILAPGPLVEPGDLRIPLSPAPSPAPAGKPRTSLRSALERPEKDILLAALRRNAWNCSRTAGELGVSRTTLYKKMKRFGITPPPRRKSDNIERAGTR